MYAHKTVLRMATPLVFNLLLDVLVVYTDFFMVARLGSDAISAVGMGAQIWSIYYAMLALFYTGENAILSRFVGAKAYKKASITLSTILIFAVVISIPLIISWNYVGQNIFYWFDAPQSVVTLGQEYIKTLAFVAPLMLLNSVFDTAMSAYGNMKVSLFINLAVVVLNAILDYMLIFGHGGFEAMGVRGAAVATVVAEIFSFTIYLSLYTQGKTLYSPMIRYSKSLLHRVLKVGLPAMVDRVLSSTSYLIFTGMVLSLGTDIYAGFQIGFRIEGLAFMPGIAFAIVASILMGQGLGEKDPDKSHRYVMISMQYGLMIMFAVSFAFMFIPERLGGFFTSDRDVLHHAALYLMIVGVSQVPLGMHFILGKALKGAGDTKRPFVLSITSMWLVRIIPSVIAVYVFHSIVGVYLAMIADTFVKAFLFWRLYHQGDWRTIRI